MISLDTLQSRQFDPNYKPEKAETMLSIGGEVIGQLESFVCYQGLPKAGKSLFVTTTIASAFFSSGLFGIKLTPLINRNRIAFFDTESSTYDFYQIIDRIKSQLNSNFLPGNLDFYNCREDNNVDLMQLIEIYLQNTPDCSILVIDGIADLVQDFNSVVESNNVIYWLKKISKIYKLLIICVLHLTKKDKNSLGHLGSFMDRKAQSTLTCEKKENVLMMSPGYMRSSSGFKPIEIVNDQGVWIEKQKSNVNDTIQGMDKQFLISKVLLEDKDYKTLTNDLMALTGKSLTYCKKLVKDWLLENLIIKTENNKYKKR
jgi:hypothetical protein